VSPTELYLTPPDWLPPLLEFEGDWDPYVDEAYGIFERDFVKDRPMFRGQRVALMGRPPEADGKDANFWHVFQAGEREQDRTPDFRRFERVRWPRAIVEAKPGDVLTWRTTRTTQAKRNDERIVVALPDFSYVTVLVQRKGYLLLWTAYCVERPRRRETFRQEWLERGF
jgi:hypothetical protein